MPAPWPPAASRDGMGHYRSRDRGDEQALFQAGLNNAGEECTTEEALLMLHEE
jgi:hypothetical protein